MEEVKCCLLGFTSELLEQALQPPSAPAAATTTTSTPEGSDATTAAADSKLRLYCQSLPFHPTEQALLLRVLPLGRAYHVLQRAAQDVAVGRTEGLYPAAVGNGVQKILAHYVEAVKAAATPSSLAALPATYAVAFTLLEHIVATQQRTEVCLPLLDRFLHHQEVPATFRRLLGESVWLAILYTTAHYVAHGVVLHARPDYFISLQTRQAAPSSSQQQQEQQQQQVPGRPSVGPSSSSNAPSRPPGEEHILYVDRLPRGISADLGLRILAAGKARRVLLRDADVQGGSDYLEQLALGSQDEAANAVFHSLFNVQLCQGGVLAAEELAARVEAAQTLWSKALWMKVGDVAALREHLAALRNIFLCHRGDIWYAFVERVLPVLASANAAAATASSSSLWSSRRRRQAHKKPGGGLLPLPDTTAPGHEEGGQARAEEDVSSVEDDESAGDEEAEQAGEEKAAAQTQAALAAAARCASLQRAAADAFLFALSVSNLRDAAAYETFTMRISASGVEQADAAFAGDGAVKDAAASTEEGKRGTSRRRRGGRAASTEDIAKHLLYLVKSMYVQYIPPQGLPLMVSPKSMHYYQRLLSFHLSLRFALQALAVTRALFSEALLTNTKPSADLRRAFTLFHLLHFLQSNIAYYMQVDVISVRATRLEEQLASPSTCASVEQAKRLHDQFIWSVSEASFLTDGSEALLQACHALNTCAVTLYTMCTRYRIPYWAVEGVNETPIEVRATLAALEARVQQDVVAVFTGHLGLGGRPWERALWGRLDFNKFLSQHRTRLTTTVTSAFAQPGGTVAANAVTVRGRPRSGSVTAGRGAEKAGRATTPRRPRASSKRAGGE